MGLWSAAVNRLGSIFSSRIRDLEQRAEILTAEVMSKERASASLVAAFTSGQIPLDDYLTDQDGEKFREAYKEMQHDAAIKAGFLPLLLTICSLDLRVTPAEAKDPRAEEIAEFVNWALRNVAGGFAGGILMKTLRPALLWQYSISEQVYASIKTGRWAGKWTLGALKSKDVTDGSWGFRLDRFRNVEALLHQEAEGQTPFPPEKFLHYRLLPDFESPRGMGHLRAAYRAWWMKKTVMRAYGEFAQRQGLVPHLKYKTIKQKSELEAQAEKFAARRWLVTPADVQAEIIQLTSSAVIGGYKDILDWLDKQIFLALQLAYLQQLEGAQTGARNMGIVHRDVTNLLPAYIALDVMGTLRTQVIERLVALNFGEGAPVPNIALEDPDARDLLKRAQIDLLLVKMGLPLSKAESYEYYGRRPPAGEEDMLEAPAPVSPFGNPFGAPGGDDGAAPPVGEPADNSPAALAGGDAWYRGFLGAYNEVKGARETHLADEAGGRWVTIHGSPVFIKEGQDVGEATRERFGAKGEAGAAHAFPERRRDRIEGTQAEADLGVKKAGARVARAQAKIDVAQTEIVKLEAKLKEINKGIEERHRARLAVIREREPARAAAERSKRAARSRGPAETYRAQPSFPAASELFHAALASDDQVRGPEEIEEEAEFLEEKVNVLLELNDALRRQEVKGRRAELGGEGEAKP